MRNAGRAWIARTLTVALLVGANVAHAEKACPPDGANKGFRPVMQEQVACAVQLGKPLLVAFACPMRMEGQGLPTYDALPGAKVNVLRASDVGVHIKLPNGEEGDVWSECLSWSDPGVSLLPNRAAKNDTGTVRALIKTLYNARKGIAQDLYNFMKKRDFVRPSFRDPEQSYSTIDPAAAYVNGLYAAEQDYGTHMRALIYGTARPDPSKLSEHLDALLVNDFTKWMADWPRVMVGTYVNGLTGSDRVGAEAADKELTLRAHALDLQIQLADLKRREKSIEVQIQGVPAERRASEKKRRLDELASKRKDLLSNIQSSLKDANQAQQQVRF